MARFLVTGGAGFIGSAVVEALAARGDSVTALDLDRSPPLNAVMSRFPAVVFRAVDLTDPQRVSRVVQDANPAAVVHCAAVVGVLNAKVDPARTFRVNVEGTLNLLEAMREAAVRRLVNLSTEEVYGPFEAPIIDETHACAPSGPYGIAKLAAELLGRDYAASREMECVHVRTCWVYGPGLARHRVPKTLIDAALAGRTLRLPRGGDFRVDHVYIDDCVQGIVKALDKKAHAFDVYHVATGDAPSLAEIVGIVRELVPGAELWIGPGNFRWSDSVEAVRKGALDITRARTELGYAPRYDIRAGLAACLEALRVKA
ncbi:MAG TPA: NAD(P)-dependent oxidoreductase [Vineibacter sp.]|nr:NAD(P)-dependent oxidoreductase [Vineibacter sp.]